MGSLNIQIQAHSTESFNIPKLVEIMDDRMNVVKSFWMESNEYVQLDPGIYGVTLNLPSGEKMRKAIKVDQDSHENIDFDLHHASPHESHEWAYFSKNIETPENVLADAKYKGAWVRFWHKENDQWEIGEVPVQDQSSWNADGVSYLFNINREQSMMQVGGPGIPWRCIALPHGYNVMCLVKPANGPAGEVHPLEVTVTSDNWKAETLLTYLSNNALEKARGLARHAESLLYGKVSDPSSAAIGGYYLIKAGELDRLHDWAANLANWMQWMADGMVIWAWQLILKGRQQRNIDFPEVKNRLLEGFKRGMPIYTEGLRMMRDGFLMLHDVFPSDADVKNALDRVSDYAEAVDWTAPTLTFNGVSPDQPSIKSRKGTPRPIENLAYIYDVPVAVMVQKGMLEVDEEVEIEMPETDDKNFRVSQEGMLISEKGNKYKSIYQAMKKGKKRRKKGKRNVASQIPSYPTIKTRSTSVDLDQFRKGRF